MLVVTVPKLCDAEYILSKVNYEKWNDTDFDIFNCTWYEKDFILLITGYGKVNIASSLQYLNCYTDIDAVLQIGTAGSLKENINVFDIFLVDKSIEANVDFTCLGYSPGVIPGSAAGTYNSNIYLKRCMIKAICDSDKSYNEGVIASCESFIANSNTRNCLRKVFCTDAVDCECGPVAHFCQNNNIPFIAIKIISNKANENAVKQYNLYNEEANKNSEKIALNFINRFE